MVGTVLGGIVGGIFGGIGGYTAGSVYHAIHDTNFNNQFVDMVIGMITSSAVLGITAFTLLLIGFMLLIRYVYLTVLLIILPLAWLAYVLPGMKSHFSKWWSLFFKWTFFPVIALFFLYLALLIISTQAAAGISFNTNVPQGLAAQSLEDIVLAGLILGGLFAANSLGLAGSKAFGNFAGNIRSGVAGYAGGIAARQGKKAASRLVPQKAMETLQSGGVPLLPKRLQVAAGTGLGNIQRAGGAKLIEKEADWAKQHSANPDEAKRLLASGGISEHRQIALIKALADKNKISHDVKVGDATIGDFLDSNENSLNRNGQGGLIKATNGLLGSNKKMRDANRGLKQATTPQEKEQAKQILEKETDEYFSEEGKDGVGKMNVNSAFGEKAFEENPELAKAQLNSIAQRQSHLLSSIVKNANGKTLNKLFGNDRTSGEYGKLLEDETRKELGSEEHSQKKARVQSLHEEALQKLNQGQDFDSLSEEIKTTLATNKQAHEIAMKDLADTFKNATRDLKSQSEITAAQREYDDKVANLKAKTQAGYITTLTQKSKEALNAIDTEARNNIRKKMGADKVEKILLNNTFTAGADASTPAPTTNP